MKKFIGDNLAWLSIILGVATVYWCWSWNWFLALVFGFIVFAFLCTLSATIDPPQPQEKVDTNDKLEVVVNNNDTEFEMTMCKIENMISKMVKDYARLDELNKELGRLQDLKPRSNEMRVRIAEEIVAKAEELLQLMDYMATDFEQIKILFNNNRDKIIKTDPRLVVNFDEFVKSNKDVFTATNKLKIQDIIYYYKEFLN